VCASRGCRKRRRVEVKDEGGRPQVVGEKSGGEEDIMCASNARTTVTYTLHKRKYLQ
jgi:hypothetical protein